MVEVGSFCACWGFGVFFFLFVLLVLSLQWRVISSEEKRGHTHTLWGLTHALFGVPHPLSLVTRFNPELSP